MPTQATIQTIETLLRCDESVTDAQREAIGAVLSEGTVSTRHAAEVLGVSERTIKRRIGLPDGHTKKIHATRSSPPGEFGKVRKGEGWRIPALEWERLSEEARLTERAML